MLQLRPFRLPRCRCPAAVQLLARSVSSAPGTLFVVAAPLGNLSDASERAISSLKFAHRIAAESMQIAEALLHRPSALEAVATPKLVSFYAHNEAERTGELLSALRQGEDVAIVPRAGTPAVCDPGRLLVQAAHREGFPVKAIPGPCSLVAALSASGLPGSRFLFDGYLPTLRSVRRSRFLRAAKLAEGREGLGALSVVFCSEGAVLAEALEDLEAALGGEVSTCVAKDLTMTYERLFAGSAAEVRRQWGELEAEAKRGTAVLLLGLPLPVSTSAEEQGAESARHPDMPQSDAELASVAKLLLKHGVSVQKAALIAAQLTGQPVERAHEVVKPLALRGGHSNRADASPHADQADGAAKLTLHLINLGRYSTKEEVTAALEQLGVHGELSIAETHLGGRIAFLRFASPEEASRARNAINLGDLRLGGQRPVVAGWARRDRWLS